MPQDLEQISDYIHAHYENGQNKQLKPSALQKRLVAIQAPRSVGHLDQ